MSYFYKHCEGKMLESRDSNTKCNFTRSFCEVVRLLKNMKTFKLHSETLRIDFLKKIIYNLNNYGLNFFYLYWLNFDCV
jgi:hypothetical protein